MKRFAILFIPFLVGFIKPTSEVRGYFQKEDWTAIKSLLILKSKSEQSLDSNLSELNEIIRSHEVCQQQLDLKSVPLKCFDVLERERSLGLLNPRRAKDIGNFLDKMCEMSVSDIKSLKDLRLQGLKKRTLSPKCRTFLSERREILRYKALDSDPDSLFKLRWQ